MQLQPQMLDPSMPHPRMWAHHPQLVPRSLVQQHPPHPHLSLPFLFPFPFSFPQARVRHQRRHPSVQQVAWSLVQYHLAQVRPQLPHP
jgi:hypothetical protein